MANLPPFKKRQEGKNGKFALLLQKAKRQKWQIWIILFKIILTKFRIIVDNFCKFLIIDKKLIIDKRQRGKNG